MAKQKDYIYGIHPLLEQLDEGKEIEKVFIQNTVKSEIIKELTNKLKQMQIPFQKVPIQKLNRISRKNHQGVIAKISPITFYKTEDIIPKLYEEGKNPFILILDKVTDTRNLGAISRTAECSGVDAIVVPMNNTAQISADAIKSSAGALLKIPICRAKNIINDIEFIKNSGIKIISATEKTDNIYTEIDYKPPIAIIMGSEGSGIGDKALDLSDSKAKIPLLGEIESLNVSVACGIILYEVVKQRLK